MKITIVAMEIPYPPIHGGRVDIWRRIEAFEQLGVEVQLICWIPEEPKAEDLAVIYRSVKNLQLLQYTGRTPLSKLRRCCELLRYPFGITSRLIYGLALQRLLGEVKQFQPDLIWIDGIHASVLARTISECLEIPFVVRSHNIEHQHRAALLRAAQGLQKIPAFLVLMHLKALEISILKTAWLFLIFRWMISSFGKTVAFRMAIFCLRWRIYLNRSQSTLISPHLALLSIGIVPDRFMSSSMTSFFWVT
ncbi:MAG: hypothetical protein HC771_05940 [Synechococcales cyanobacterium CRU_2_2]|nr:hypothetical protein [Synechococcales cyanobacterium CRU_2_2]